MKKIKLLTPILGIASVAAAATPLVTLTSCNNNNDDDEQIYVYKYWEQG